MTTTLLLTPGLILLLLFVALTTFSNSTKAYAAISLVPLALGLTVFGLRSISAVSAVEPSPGYWWPDLYEKIVWASALQTGLGIGLIARALYRRRPVVLLLLTTFLTGSLVWLRATRWM